MRALRSYHPRPEIRDTLLFSTELANYLGAPLKPATINRLENGDLAFDIRRVLAYEQALQVEPTSLVDVYIYLMRLDGHAPRTQAHDLVTEAQYHDLLFKLAHGDELYPMDWLRLTWSISARGSSLLESPRYRAVLFDRLIQQYGDSFERDERLLREALIILGDAAVPSILESARSAPIRYFNSIEVLGFSRSETAWNGLTSLAAEISDPANVQTLIEPIRRQLRADRSRLASLMQHAPNLVPYCLAILVNPNEAYTSREEALLLVSRRDLQVSSHWKRRLGEYEPDLNQLRLKLEGPSRQEVSSHLISSLQGLVGNTCASALGMPQVIPGLKDVLENSIFGQERVERLGLGVALSPLSISGDLSIALGRTLLLIDSRDYGVQRSILRLMTKMAHPASHEFFTTFSKRRIVDDGTRLTTAWALGTGTCHEDERCLRLLIAGATPMTRRVIALAAARRKFHVLLSELAKDPDTQVASEARAALRQAGIRGP